MYRLVLILFVLAFNATIAQQFEWVKSIGGIDLATINSVCVDQQGNTIATGEFWGTVDFDPGSGTELLTANNFDDIFVQKLDPNGNLIWAKSLGGSSFDKGKVVIVDGNDNIYIGGDFRSTVDFDPSAGIFELTPTGINDAFILKLSPNGDFIWAKAFNGTETVYLWDIAFDSNGHICLTGDFRGTYDFDPSAGVANHSSNGNADIFIQKMDTNGNYIWSKTIGGIDNDRSNTIDIGSNGTIFIAGYFESTVDFDPGVGLEEHTSNGAFDAYVLKLDQNGNYIWSAAYGGNGNDIVEGLAVDDNYQVYLSGGFHQTVDFDPGPGIANATSQGSLDVFVQKLDDNGNLLWIKSFGGSTFDPVSSMVIDENQNIFTVGVFSQTVDFDPGTNIQNRTSLGSSDLFIQKLTTSGDLDWVETIGGIDIDDVSSIFLQNNKAYLSGRFWSTVDFDFGPGIEQLTPTGGNEDAFLLKLLTCKPDSTIDVQTSCGSYTWIDEMTYTSSNNTATHTLKNSEGCDSVITLNLTINNVDASVVQTNDSTLQANTPGATYQWIDCNDNDPVLGETDQSFVAPYSGSFAVIVTDNNCSDTSDCLTINYAGLQSSMKEKHIQIYPNPTVDHVTITVNNQNVDKLQLTNSIGQVLETISSVQKENSFDMSALPKGMYFIQVNIQQQRFIRPIVKL